MTSRHVTTGELGAQVQRLEALISRLDDQLASHEAWHRDVLLRSGERGQSARLAVIAMIISAVAALGAVIAAAVALHH